MDGTAEFNGANSCEQQDTPGECGRFYPEIVAASGQRQCLTRQHIQSPSQLATPGTAVIHINSSFVERPYCNI